MSEKALIYMNNVISELVKKYGLPETDAAKAVKNSYLYVELLTDPEMAMHDSVRSSAEDVYKEIYGM